jgi:hypothetical protein
MWVIAFCKVMWNEGTSQNAIPTQSARTLTPYGVSMKSKIFVGRFLQFLHFSWYFQHQRSISIKQVEGWAGR